PATHGCVPHPLTSCYSAAMTRANTHRPVKIWLLTVFTMVLLMTLIGGITRLTGSGLSMVQWHPLMGAIPPIGEAAWLDVFAKYQQTPQYQQVNDWMTLADFQRIFFWEYLHRLFGRTIGIVVLVPWVVLIAMRRIDLRLGLKTLVMFVLGGLQGLLGWYMVKSGLVDAPHVSHFRLAAHLLLAFAVAQYVLWIYFGLTPGRGQRVAGGLIVGAWSLVCLVVVQVVWGAFMAGLRAGHMSATFPQMNGQWLPGAFVDAELGWMISTVSAPMMVHWVHRAVAWILLLAFAGFAAWALRAAPYRLRFPTLVLTALVALQFGLGVATVMLHVPIVIAVAHQGVALLLLSSLTWWLMRARSS
ncbi:MAG: cytochrome c oxidase assembly protein subunit 15, partial [Kiritimatiellia bacterium]